MQKYIHYEKWTGQVIEYGKKATVKLNIFPDEEILKIIIDKYLIQTFIDEFLFDNIQFIHPILKIYIHSY